MILLQLTQQQYQEKKEELHQKYEVFDIFLWYEDIAKDPSKLNGLMQSAKTSALQMNGINAVSLLAMSDKSFQRQILEPVLHLHLKKFRRDHPDGVVIAEPNVVKMKAVELKQLSDLL